MPSPAPAPTAELTREPFGKLRPFITPNHELYVQSIRGGLPPEIKPDEFRLSIEGLVERPTSLALDEIMALPAVEEMRTLECVGNPPGGDLIGNIVWTGTPLRPILEKAGVKGSAVELILRSADGYSTSLPVDVLLRPDVLLVYKMNGQPLPRDHGFPLRINIPGRYGQKQPKWLQRMEAVSEPYLGYYERQGWSNECFIKPNSRIDYPVDYEPTVLGEIVVRGVGMAGVAGVKTVEVSFDDGATWEAAQLSRGPSNLVWVFWEVKWRPDKVNRYNVLAKVTDNNGTTQRRQGQSFSLLGESFPDGTDVMHAIRANIVDKLS